MLLLSTTGLGDHLLTCANKMCATVCRSVVQSLLLLFVSEREARTQQLQLSAFCPTGSPLIGIDWVLLQGIIGAVVRSISTYL